MLLEDSWHQYVLVRNLLKLSMSGEDRAVRAGQAVLEAVICFYAQMGKVQDLVISVLLDELASLSASRHGTLTPAPTTTIPSNNRAPLCSSVVRALMWRPPAHVALWGLWMAAQRVLFREDSMGLRMFTAFLNREGKEYLELLTAPIFHAVSVLDSPLEVRLCLPLFPFRWCSD